MVVIFLRKTVTTGRKIVGVTWFKKEEKIIEKQDKEMEENKDNEERMFSIIYAVFSSHVRLDLQ